MILAKGLHTALQTSPNEGTVLVSSVCSASDTAEWKFLSNGNINRAASDHSPLCRKLCDSSGPCSKWGSRMEAVLSLTTQRSMNHWDLRRAQTPMELVTERGWSYHMPVTKAGLQISLISWHFTDCFHLRDSSRRCQGQVDSLLSIQAKLLSATSLLILIFPRCYWLNIRLRDSCLLLPFQGWLFPQPEEQSWIWACLDEGWAAPFLQNWGLHGN